jgi:hypothetical protein
LRQALLLRHSSQHMCEGVNQQGCQGKGSSMMLLHSCRYCSAAAVATAAAGVSALQMLNKQYREWYHRGSSSSIRMVSVSAGTVRIVRDISTRSAQYDSWVCLPSQLRNSCCR